MRPFTPPFWMKSPHLQTAGSVFVPRSLAAFPSEDRYFDLADGSKLSTECSWQPGKRNATTLLVIHGLNGSTISSYSRGTASKAYAAGFNVVRINLRNGGNREELSKTFLHAGQSDDIQAVIEELVTKDRLPRIGIIAFSFGGNISLKMLGEWKSSTPSQIVGMVGISPLIDLDGTANSLDLKAPPIYRRQMLKGLKSMARKRHALLPGMYSIDGLEEISTLRAYDNAFAPYYGFKDAADYYAKAACLPLLGNVTVPTLLITSKDDAVIPAASFARISNPRIEIILTEHGGHGGFIAAKKGADPDRHWAENRAVEFFKGR